MAHIIVTQAGKVLRRKENFAKIFRTVNHQTVGQGLVDHIPDLVGLWAKNGGAGHDHFFAYADQQVGITAAQQGINQLEMLHDDALAVLNGDQNGISQVAELGKPGFKTDIHVVRVGREETTRFLYIQQRQRTHIQTVIVIGQFQIGKHAPDQRALAGAGITDDANELVERGEVQLRQLHTQRIHALTATGGEIGADNMRLLPFLHRSILHQWYFRHYTTKNRV